MTTGLWVIERISDFQAECYHYCLNCSDHSKLRELIIMIIIIIIITKAAITTPN